MNQEIKKNAGLPEQVDLAELVSNKYSLEEITVKYGLTKRQAEKTLAFAAAVTEYSANIRAVDTKLKAIRSSCDLWEIMRPYFLNQEFESFYIVCLNRANYVKKVVLISTGGVSGTVVDAKLVFKNALDCMASSIVLVHNHPSGNLKPSQADIDLTKKLRKAGEVMDIGVLDHLILCGLETHYCNYYSFSDEGIL